MFLTTNAKIAFDSNDNLCGSRMISYHFLLLDATKDFFPTHWTACDIIMPYIMKKWVRCAIYDVRGSTVFQTVSFIR